MNPRHRFVPAIAGLAFCTALTAQTTVTVLCAQDNTLYEDPAGLLSNGAGPSLFVGVTGQLTNPLRRALLQFDVAAAVPAGAHIVSAELSITTTQSSAFAPLDVFGHRVTQAWGEGTSVAPGAGGGGGPATPGDATWIHAISPSPLWANTGGDFAANPSLVITTQPVGTATSDPSALLIADVQSMLDNPGGNHGWLLKTTEALAFLTRKIDSRETVIGTPPSLTVGYLMPGQTGTFGTGCAVGTGTFDYSISGPATGGTTVNLVQVNGPATQFAANLLSLGFDPAGSVLVPGCLLYLPFGQIVTQSLVPLDNAGSGTASFLLPSGYPGVAIYAQSAALDGSPTGFVLSNAAIAVLQ